MLRTGALLIALLAAGCGPGGIGFALSELFGGGGGNAAAEIANILGLADFVGDADPEVTVTAARRNVAFEASVDGSDFVRFSGADDGGEGSSVTFRLSDVTGGPLADGEHLFEVRTASGGETVPRSFFVDTAAPGPAPVVESATTPAPRTVHVVWSASDDPGEDPSGLDRYVVTCVLDVDNDAATADRVATIERNQPGTIIHIVTTNVDPTQTTLVLTGLQAAVRYVVSVEAFDRAGQSSGTSAAVTVRTRAGGAGTLSAPATYSTGGTACGVRVADLNGDGAPDIATAVAAEGTEPGRVAVLLRRPGADVTFQGNVSAATLATALFDPVLALPMATNAPRGLEIGDYDAGGPPDIAVFSDDATSGGSIEVLYGAPLPDPAPIPPTFDFGDTEFHGGLGPVSSITFGILDDRSTPDFGFTVEPDSGDAGIPLPSHVDLLPRVRGAVPAGAARFEHTFEFGFFDYTTILVPVPRLETIVVLGVEFTIVVGVDQIPACQRGASRAVFQGSGAHASVAADFDRDGFTDLAFCDLNTVRVARGAFSCRHQLDSPNTTFTKFEAAAPFVTGPDPHSLVLEDMDADGNLDLVVSHAGGGLVVLYGKGDGTFETGAFLATGNTGREAGAADFNSDGVLDLAVADEEGFVWLALGRGDRTFGAAQRFLAGGRPTSLALGDFNEDLIPDVVVNDKDGDGVRILFGTGALLGGNGTFNASIDLDVGHVLDLAGVVATDFDRDGRMDIVAVSSGTVGPAASPVDLITTVQGPFQSREGAAAGGAQRFPEFGTELSARHLLAADFDRDGLLDVVAAGPGGVQFFRGATGPAGDGLVFVAGRRIVPAGTGKNYSGLVRTDLNQDGIPDLAFLEWDAAGARVLASTVNGAGAFADPVPVATGIEADFDGDPSLAAADVDGDAVVDLTLLDDQQGAGDRYVILSGVRVPGPTLLAFAEREAQSANAELATVAESAFDVAPRSVRSGDFNGDGRSDLAWLNVETGELVILLRSSGEAEGGDVNTPGGCLAIHGGTGERLELEEDPDNPGDCLCPTVQVFLIEDILDTNEVVAKTDAGGDPVVEQLVFRSADRVCAAPDGFQFDGEGRLIELIDLPVVDDMGTPTGEELQLSVEQRGQPRYLPPEGFRIVEDANGDPVLETDPDPPADEVPPPQASEMPGQGPSGFNKFVFGLPAGLAGNSRLAQTDAGGSGAGLLAVGDFNSDGIVDVAALVDGRILVVRGRLRASPIRVQGDPTVVGVEAIGMAAGDYNDDGVLDLVLAKAGGGLRVFFGEGKLSDDPLDALPTSDPDGGG